MTNAEIIVSLLSLISVFISSYLAYKTSKNKYSIQTQKNLMEAEMQFRTQLMESLDELRIRIKTIENENYRLKKDLMSAELKIKELKELLNEEFNTYKILESFCSNIPSPAWIKSYNYVNDKFIMSYINKSYSTKWDISNSYYKGKTDEEIWGPEIAKQFSNHDRAVVLYKKGMMFTESIPKDHTDKTGKNCDRCLIWKFPIFDEDDHVIAVGGIAIPIDELSKWV